MSVFNDSTYYTGPDLTSELVREAEEALGYRLPEAYVALLEERNGGVPRGRCVMTDFWTPSAPGFVEIKAIRGIGGEWGIDAEVGGSAYMVSEWGYPDVGVVFCNTAAGGHDAVMLDYRECGPSGEPSVVYVEEDRVPRTIAASFADFVADLVECPEIEEVDLE